MNISEMLTPSNEELFFKRGDQNDVRLGEIVPFNKYESSDIVILGCPQDEGVTRNQGRGGAALAPAAIRREFYKLTPFGITKNICDAGNITIQDSLEATHDTQAKIVSQILGDGKTLIVLGGGNDISYPDGAAMANAFGAENWIAINIDAHFDVREAAERNSGTPYRLLLEEKLLRPDYFYEVAFQTEYASPVYYRYLRNLGVNLLSLEQLRDKDSPDSHMREAVRNKFIHHSQSLNAFFGFDLDAVRASDAPGTSVPSPVGLQSGEFLNLVTYAGNLVNTKLIEFTEVNPNFDIDNRTTKLVAVAMHRFCVAKSSKI
ncbi:MAG: formimidoylglutamase [Pyrinomonadaceae bacterium]